MCGVRDNSCVYWLQLVFRYIHQSCYWPALVLVLYCSIDLLANNHARLVTLPFL